MTEESQNPLSSSQLGLARYEGKLKIPKMDVGIEITKSYVDIGTLTTVPERVCKIPFTELKEFFVITGEGKRKPGISFEHKPDVDRTGKCYFVYMKTGKMAEDCADALLATLKEIADDRALAENLDVEGAGAGGKKVKSAEA